MIGNKRYPYTYVTDAVIDAVVRKTHEDHIDLTQNYRSGDTR